MSISSAFYALIAYFFLSFYSNLMIRWLFVYIVWSDVSASACDFVVIMKELLISVYADPV